LLILKAVGILLAENVFALADLLAKLKNFEPVLANL